MVSIVRRKADSALATVSIKVSEATAESLKTLRAELKSNDEIEADLDAEIGKQIDKLVSKVRKEMSELQGA